jgi:hypothetical protein
VKIPEHLKRQNCGHGYHYGCECDLYDNGDPECTIDLPYETVGAYIERLIKTIIDLESKIK